MKIVISKLLQAGASVKNYCFANGLIKPHSVGVPVISVGNLAAGGRGKTSLVQWLATQFDQPAVLTRGYRSQLEHKTPKLIDAHCDPKVCGDEPALIARMQQAPLVFVGKNRCESAKMAALKGAKVIILDDGMQYRYLKRDVEIVLVNEKDFTGKEFLRERLSELKRADLVVIMGVDDRNALSVLLKDIERYTDAPVCAVRYRLNPMHGKKIAAFCALGNPERFFEDLKSAGAEIVATMVKRDHLPFKERELAELASQADLLVCTAKDWVKLKNIDLPIECVHAELEWVFGKEHIQRIVDETMD